MGGGEERGRERRVTPRMPSTPSEHSLVRHFPFLNKEATITF